MNDQYIRIKTPETSRAHDAFYKLMDTTERILNDGGIVRKNNLTAFEVETVTLNAIKDATKTIDVFRPEDVILISGFNFPDIEIKPSYGVEVKTSHSGWSSIGSSIIESTRIPNIELIYMVFGNLKNNPPIFKCKSYDSVLTDIKVTHSPRYLIDMETSVSIFDEIGIPYQIFREKDEHEKIEIAQLYTREKFKRKGQKEMPWWIKNIQDPFNNGVIKIWNCLSIEEKKRLTAQCMVLFPSVLSPNPSQTKYNEATLWLCSYHQVVTPNIRDIFSSGGRSVYGLNTNVYQIPAVYRKVKEHIDIIKRILTGEDSELLVQMEIYNPELYNVSSSERFDYWIENISACNLGLPIKKFLLTNSDNVID